MNPAKRIRLTVIRPVFSLACALLIFALSACGETPRPVQPTPAWVTVTPAIGLTATPTPFLPPESTAVPAAPPAEMPAAGLPLPAAPLVKPTTAVTILLLGSDQRPGHSDFRTDVFVLLTLRGDGSVSLVSFPRDLYVYLPSLGTMNRINTAYEFGGFDLAARTLEYNFGVRPDHFILTSFDGFISIINSLGGVEVNAALELSDSRPGYPNGFTVSPGLVHMDGETALWYVRSRATTGDFDRLRRAQEVLVAIGQKLLTLQGLARLPELYQTYRSSVVTDLTLDDLLALLPLLQQTDPNRVDRYVIVPPSVTPWTHPDTGAYLLLPDTPVIQQILQQALVRP